MSVLKKKKKKKKRTDSKSSYPIFYNHGEGRGCYTYHTTYNIQAIHHYLTPYTYYDIMLVIIEEVNV